MKKKTIHITNENFKIFEYPAEDSLVFSWVKSHLTEVIPTEYESKRPATITVIYLEKEKEPNAKVIIQPQWSDVQREIEQYILDEWTGISIHKYYTLKEALNVIYDSSEYMRNRSKKESVKC